MVAVTGYARAAGNDEPPAPNQRTHSCVFFLGQVHKFSVIVLLIHAPFFRDGIGWPRVLEMFEQTKPTKEAAPTKDAQEDA